MRGSMREGGLALELADAPAAEPSPPPEGIVLQPVAARPEFGAGAYEVAAQTWRDIPGETGVQERDAWLSVFDRVPRPGIAPQPSG